MAMWVDISLIPSAESETPENERGQTSTRASASHPLETPASNNTQITEMVSDPPPDEPSSSPCSTDLKESMDPRAVAVHTTIKHDVVFSVTAPDNTTVFIPPDFEEETPFLRTVDSEHDLNIGTLKNMDQCASSEPESEDGEEASEAADGGNKNEAGDIGICAEVRDILTSPQHDLIEFYRSYRMKKERDMSHANDELVRDRISEGEFSSEGDHCQWSHAWPWNNSLDRRLPSIDCSTNTSHSVGNYDFAYGSSSMQLDEREPICSASLETGLGISSLAEPCSAEIITNHYTQLSETYHIPPLNSNPAQSDHSPGDIHREGSDIEVQPWHFQLLPFVPFHASPDEGDDGDQISLHTTPNSVTHHFHPHPTAKQVSQPDAADTLDEMDNDNDNDCLGFQLAKGMAIIYGGNTPLQMRIHELQGYVGATRGRGCRYWRCSGRSPLWQVWTRD